MDFSMRHVFLLVLGALALALVALAQPAATTAALAPFPTIAGSAAALLGFAQTGGGLAGSLAAALMHEPVLALATVIPAMTVIALAAQIGLGRLNAAREAAAEQARLAPGE